MAPEPHHVVTAPSRTFRNDSQRDCYEYVAQLLGEIFGDGVVVHPDLPTFRVLMGSTAVDLTVYAFERDAVVHLRALVVHGARPDLDLYETLLRQNAKLVAGAFSIDADGDIAFTHTIPVLSAADTAKPSDSGSDGKARDRPRPPITRASLERDVVNVLDVADHFDDFIQGRWGGQRTIDRG